MILESVTIFHVEPLDVLPGGGTGGEVGLKGILELILFVAVPGDVVVQDGDDIGRRGGTSHCVGVSEETLGDKAAGDGRAII